MELLFFFIKTIIIIAAILAITLGIVIILSKGKGDDCQRLRIKKINKKYKAIKEQLQSIMLSKNDFKKLSKQLKKEKKKEKKQTNEEKRKLFVLHFDGDIKASAVSSLREEVTALLTVATPKDEVLACVNSQGGMVHAYGLAASQLKRIRDRNIPLTVAIDKVAASGGYMMACVADKIIAAPFAIVGSIGAVIQMPNFHRFLKKHNIDFEQLTAGEYKRTLTVFGENTNKGRDKMQEDLEDVHHLFKRFISDNRSKVNIESVATGEHWYGFRAQELNLVDELITSDDYLYNAHSTHDIFELTYHSKASFMDKLSDKMTALFFRGSL